MNLTETAVQVKIRSLHVGEGYKKDCLAVQPGLHLGAVKPSLAGYSYVFRD